VHIEAGKSLESIGRAEEVSLQFGAKYRLDRLCIMQVCERCYRITFGNLKTPKPIVCYFWLIQSRKLLQFFTFRFWKILTELTFTCVTDLLKSVPELVNVHFIKADLYLIELTLGCIAEFYPITTPLFSLLQDYVNSTHAPTSPCLSLCTRKIYVYW